MAGKVKVDHDWNYWRLEYAKDKPTNLKKWVKERNAPFSYVQAKNNIRKKDLPEYEKALDRRMKVDDFLAKGDAVNPIKNSRAMISVLQEWLANNYKPVLVDKDIDALTALDDRGRVAVDPAFAMLKDMGYWLIQEKKILNELSKTLHDTQKLESTVAKIIEVLSPTATPEQVEQVKELFAQLKSPVTDAYEDEY